MAKFWVKDTQSATRTGVGLDVNVEIYHNNSAHSSTTRKFTATVVDRHVMCISDTDDVFEMRWLVLHESFPTPTTATPDDQDESVRGIFPWARGPVFFNPRAKISVPPDHKLYLQVNKTIGSTSSTYALQSRVLFVTDD